MTNESSDDARVDLTAGHVEEAADPNPPDTTDIGAVEAVADPPLTPDGSDGKKKRGFRPPGKRS